MTGMGREQPIRQAFKMNTQIALGKAGVGCGFNRPTTMSTPIALRQVGICQEWSLTKRRHAKENPAEAGFIAIKIGTD